MIFITKLVTALLLPSGLVFFLLLCGLLLKRWLPLWTGAILFLLFSMPAFSDALIRALEGADGRNPVTETGRADAIVVLGGMTQQVRGAPLGEWKDAADRFEGGIELYRAGKAPLLLFTRGRLPWRVREVPEGELLARRAVALGVPEKAILLSAVAANTGEEAAAVRRLCDEGKLRQPTTIILVTSAFHMRRASQLFERQGFRVLPFRVDFQVGSTNPLTLLSFLPNADAFLQSEKAMRELLALGLLGAGELRTQD
ncbi:MAG: YdcF family protein [Chlorobiaceae bacterium]|nr:YdcF family protein [Chlorobiaceae bacterium]